MFVKKKKKKLLKDLQLRYNCKKNTALPIKKINKKLLIFLNLLRVSIQKKLLFVNFNYSREIFLFCLKLNRLGFINYFTFDKKTNSVFIFLNYTNLGSALIQDIVIYNNRFEYPVSSYKLKSKKASLKLITNYTGIYYFSGTFYSDKELYFLLQKNKYFLKGRNLKNFLICNIYF